MKKFAREIGLVDLFEDCPCACNIRKIISVLESMTNYISDVLMGHFSIRPFDAFMHFFVIIQLILITKTNFIFGDLLNFLVLFIKSLLFFLFFAARVPRYFLNFLRLFLHLVVGCLHFRSGLLVYI
jgi:hypothetical protein